MHSGKPVEDLDVRLARAEMVEVIGLDIGHDDDVGPVLEQRTIALVGLGYEHLAGAVVRVGAGLVELPAHRERRVEPTMLERHHRHRRR